MENITNELLHASENEVVKWPEYKGDLLDQMEDEYFAKPKNKQQKIKTITHEHEEIKKDLKTKIEDLLLYQNQKNQEISRVLNYKDKQDIKKEQYESKKNNVKNFREKNRVAIDASKDLLFQKQKLQKELEAEDRVYEKKIWEMYQKICESELTNLDFRQFKRLLSVDREEFARRFHKDTQMQCLAEITWYDRKYIDEVWSEYYGKWDYADDNDRWGTFENLVSSIYKMHIWDEVSVKFRLPYFNDQQKNFFVSMFNDNIKTEGVRTLEDIWEVFDRYIKFIEWK